jgi:predicted nucleic acid-binding protein
MPFVVLVIAFTPTADLLVDAYDLAITHRRTVYDSLYLSLSIREACRFVTADERLANAVSSAIPTVVWLGNWR